MTYPDDASKTLTLKISHELYLDLANTAATEGVDINMVAERYLRFARRLLNSVVPRAYFCLHRPASRG